MSDLTCCRSASTSAEVAGVEFEGAGDDETSGDGARLWAEASATELQAHATKINFLIKTPDQNGHLMPTNETFAFDAHWISSVENARTPLPRERGRTNAQERTGGACSRIDISAGAIKIDNRRGRNASEDGAGFALSGSLSQAG